MGRVAAGKTTLMQRLKGEQISYCKTQYVNYTDTIIDTPGEYAENGELAAALALYTYEADIVGLLIALPAGVYSATHQYTKRDYAVVTASFFAGSIPGFFLALLLTYFFNAKLGWLPSGGMMTAGTGGGFLDVARHMVMPVTVLAVWEVAFSAVSEARASILREIALLIL